MRVGYSCANKKEKLHTNHLCRLSSFGIPKLKEVVSKNIDHLKQILRINTKQHLHIFRIGSEFVPFAGHENMQKLKSKWHWRTYFAPQLKHIGETLIQKAGIRVTMHPDHYCLLNSNDEKVYKRSLDELEYHAELFDAMGLDATHKIQIYVGGVYGDKSSSIERFVEKYKLLSDTVKKYLIIENDDHLYSVDDCMKIYWKCAIPVSLNTLHHEAFNTSGDTMRQAFMKIENTWDKDVDGLPLVVYGSQNSDGRRGAYADKVDMEHFEKVVCKRLMRTEKSNALLKFDLLVEAGDREQSTKICYAMVAKYFNTLHVEKTGWSLTEEEQNAEKLDVIEQARLSLRDVESGNKLKKAKREHVADAAEESQET